MKRTMPRLTMAASSITIGQSLRARSGTNYAISRLIQQRPDGPHGVFEVTTDDRKYVLKTISRSQFDREETIWRRLHKSTLNRLPLDAVDEPKAFVYEHLGEDLQSLSKRAKFTRKQIKEISRTILEAIAELHEIDYLHGGIFYIVSDSEFIRF
ncbi:MAG: RIBULOSE-phosphate 3-epimerase [Cirrosporium novae-zelandiae]|nr:MAG: RIBULOSE-phosphate 3-epimerase [Cirrosporium novae-zelandiae]